MGFEFVASPRHTLGVEIEMSIVDRDDGHLVCAASEIIEAMVGMGEDGVRGEHPKVKNELFESTIELITGICETAADAHADLSATVAEVRPHLDRRGLALMGSGVHPFTAPEELERTQGERYASLVERIQWPARRLMITGVHFHVGVPSGDAAIAVVNGLTMFLPHLVALSASSPYWLGEDTGLASTRTKIFEAMPSTGLPPRLEGWAEFEQFGAAMIKAGTIETIREVWWDVRPHPNYGTVELRMCDGISTLKETVALAAFAQCAVAYLVARHTAGHPVVREPDWVLRENKWRAARYGLEAKLMDGQGQVRGIVDEVNAWREEFAPFAKSLGCERELASIDEIFKRGASYQRQRAMVASGASLSEVVRAMISEFGSDRIGG